MLDESHKKNSEEAAGEQEVPLENTKLKFTVRQIRQAIFGHDEDDWPDSFEDKDIRQEQITKRKTKKRMRIRR